MARILIVEDDESIRNLIELTLMQFQYETVSFEDAETAWEPVLNSFESVKMSQTLYLKALGPFFVRP